MTLDELIDYYGSGRKACEALGVVPQNYTRWKRENKIPYVQQMRLEKITEGVLRAESDIINFNSKDK